MVKFVRKGVKKLGVLALLAAVGIIMCSMVFLLRLGESLSNVLFPMGDGEALFAHADDAEALAGATRTECVKERGADLVAHLRAFETEKGDALCRGRSAMYVGNLWREGWEKITERRTE